MLVQACAPSTARLRLSSTCHVQHLTIQFRHTELVHIVARSVNCLKQADLTSKRDQVGGRCKLIRRKRRGADFGERIEDRRKLGKLVLPKRIKRLLTDIVKRLHKSTWPYDGLSVMITLIQATLAVGSRGKQFY